MVPPKAQHHLLLAVVVVVAELACSCCHMSKLIVFRCGEVLCRAGRRTSRSSRVDLAASCHSIHVAMSRAQRLRPEACGPSDVPVAGVQPRWERGGCPQYAPMRIAQQAIQRDLHLPASGRYERNINPPTVLKCQFQTSLFATESKSYMRDR